MSTTRLLRIEPPLRQAWLGHVRAISGAAFVVLTFAGNSLTESVIDPSTEPTPAQALEDFETKATSPIAQTGLAMEMLGFVALTVFIGFLLETLHRKRALGPAGILAVVAATIMLAVKLASGAPYLAGLAYYDVLTPDTALALSLTNGAGFVICWLPFAVFVSATALALHTADILGRLGAAAGVTIGLAGVLAAVGAVTNPAAAMPVPFLLGCLWTLAISVKISLKTAAINQR